MNILNFEKRISDLTQKVKELEGEIECLENEMQNEQDAMFLSIKKACERVGKDKHGVFPLNASMLADRIIEIEEDLKNSQDNCSELELCKSELEACVVPNDVFRRTDAKRLELETRNVCLEGRVVELEKENEPLKSALRHYHEKVIEHVKELEKENAELKNRFINLKICYDCSCDLDNRNWCAECRHYLKENK